jgi:DNA polymerase III subunit alpha, Gram-positive type
MPFSSIEGLGAAVAMDIVSQREEQPFRSLDDIRTRTRINKTLFEKLEDLGAFRDVKSENHVIDDGLFALDA